jgi:hypothetical protein
MKDTPHSIALWCNDQDEKVKALQDICLDHPLDQEAKEILIRLSQIQEEIEMLSSDCIKGLFA